MDFGENALLLMTDEAVGMSCQTEVDGTAGAPVEPVSKGTMLKNGSSWIPHEWLEWPGTAVGAFMSSSASSVMLPHSGGCVIVASVAVKLIVSNLTLEVEHECRVGTYIYHVSS